MKKYLHIVLLSLSICGFTLAAGTTTSVKSNADTDIITMTDSTKQSYTIDVPNGYYRSLIDNFAPVLNKVSKMVADSIKDTKNSKKSPKSTLESQIAEQISTLPLFELLKDNHVNYSTLYYGDRKTQCTVDSLIVLFGLEEGAEKTAIQAKLQTICADNDKNTDISSIKIINVIQRDATLGIPLSRDFFELYRQEMVMINHKHYDKLTYAEG